MIQLRATQSFLILTILFHILSDSEAFTLTSSSKANTVSPARRQTSLNVATEIGIGEYEGDLRGQNERLLEDETVRQTFNIDQATMPSWIELPKSSKTISKVSEGTFLESVEIYTGRIAMVLAFIFFSVEMMTGMSLSQQVSIFLQNSTP